MKFKIILYFILLLSIFGPLWLLITEKISLNLDYRTADRQSAHLAPDPHTTREAVIQVYAARSFNWRGMFSVHTWLATKAKDADHYIVYQVVGWQALHGLSPLMQHADIPDRNWFAQTPIVIRDIRGAQAEKLIPKIIDAVKNYPAPNEYTLWPGPNSNTFIAYIGRKVPELRLVMPATAIGKDYLFGWNFFAKAPSGTGYQISLFGVLGITLALYEGLEINLGSAIFGISPRQLAIKIPGIGEMGLQVFSNTSAPPTLSPP